MRSSRKYKVKGFSKYGYCTEYVLSDISLYNAIKYVERHLEKCYNEYDYFKIYSNSGFILRNIEKNN